VCPVLGAHGLALVCGLETEDGVVRVTTRLAHASGPWVETTLAVPQPATLQELGSAVTYLKCYAINTLLTIEGETDDDGNLADDNTIVASGEPAPADPGLAPPTVRHPRRR
jgi:ERF superfamily